MADEDELSRGAEERLRAQIDALRAEIRNAVGRSAVASADLAARVDVAPTPAVTGGPTSRPSRAARPGEASRSP